jgi:hypothetical protein
MTGIIPRGLRGVRSSVREDHIHLHHLLQIKALFNSKRGLNLRLKSYT